MMEMTEEQAIELDRQIGCVIRRIMIISDRKLKGSLTIHFDRSGFLGKNFTENFTLCRDSFSPTKMGREIGEEELAGILARKVKQ